jgi:hypothetical protein
VGFDSEAGALRIKAPTQALSGWAGKTADFWSQLEQWNLEGFTVQLLCVNSGERRRLLELLEERGYRPGQDRL